MAKSIKRGRLGLIIAAVAVITAGILVGVRFGLDDRNASTPATSDTITSAAAPGTRISWQGQEWFLAGANMPWYRWACDFGCNKDGGVSSTSDEISERLAEAKSAGVHNLRWWLFPGDPWQIQRDTTGAPVGIDPAVYADIDAALLLAEQHDISLTFTIFSAPSAFPQDWLTDATRRDGLAKVLGTLFAHYRDNPRILAWEAINEPEWDIWNDKVAEADVVDLVSAVNAQVHANSSSLTTVGNANLEGIALFKDAGIDFFSPHWYDAMSSGPACARCTDYAAVRSRYGIEVPVVIGEFYAGTDTDALQRFTDLFDKGFAGAWAWSLFPEKTDDKLNVDLAAVAEFSSTRDDVGPRSAQSSVGLPAKPGNDADGRPSISCTNTGSTLVVSGNTVTATFDGAPASPTSFCANDWDIAVTSRDTDTWYELEPMSATHGPDCAGPPATHQHDGNYEDSVFSCRDHVMTAINASGYGLVYLTPAAVLDFSTREAVLKFDASTFRASGRDWLDVWITPYEDNLQLPLDDWLPDLQGEPRRAIHIRMEGPLGDTKFRAYVINDHVATELPSNWGPLEQTLKMDETRRDTFEFRISSTHVKFGMPGYNRWWIDSSFANLGWNSGVVQLGQHAYNPTKDVGGQPGTIHWDNLVMSPAIPFTVLRADYRYADDDGQSIRFEAPAPVGSHLRFSAVGLVDVSFDGGKTWQRATRQAQELAKPEHFSSYWMPIPTGTQQVLFRGEADDWFDRWFAKDFTIWSRS